MNTGLLPVFADSLIEVEQIVPFDTGRSFDHFHSYTCFHKPNSDRSRVIGAANKDLFYLFPRQSNKNQEHYLFGPICIGSHNSLFIDIQNQAVNKWSIVDRFPGLWKFFSSDCFRVPTINHPALFWHVPKHLHDSILADVKNDFLSLAMQKGFADWDHELHYELSAHWDEDDWDLAYRLSQGTCRSLEINLQKITDFYVNSLDIDNIDIEIFRRRLLRKIVKQQILSNTLIAKLLSAMKSSQDSRADITELTIINQLVISIDSILIAVIKQHLGK